MDAQQNERLISDKRFWVAIAFFVAFLIYLLVSSSTI